MADEKRNNRELSDEELNDVAGGFVLSAKQAGFIECANEGCKKKFRPLNGETLCEDCRKGASKIF